MIQSKEELTAAAAKAKSASADAYERFVAQAKTVAAAGAGKLPETLKERLPDIPSAATFRHGAIRLLRRDAGETNPAVAPEPKSEAGAALEPPPVPEAQAVVVPEPEPEAQAVAVPEPEPEPEAAAAPEPDPAVEPQAEPEAAAASQPNLHNAYLAAGAEVMAARAAAGTPEGDARLAEAVKARDEALAAWKASSG